MPRAHADGTVTDATQAPDPDVETHTPDDEPAAEPELAPDEPADENPSPRRRARGTASKDSR